MMRILRWVAFTIPAMVILVVSVFAMVEIARKEEPAKVTDYASCVKAGYPVTQAQPRQCKTPSGVVYTEAVEPSDNGPTDGEPSEPKSCDYSSPKGVVVHIDKCSTEQPLTSPLTISGTIPGNWSFEASFPVVLTDWDGRIIAQEPAQLLGDWMTAEDVPFTVKLTFDTPTLYKNGALILQKDNPSDLSANDDAIEIPVNYK